MDKSKLRKDFEDWSGGLPPEGKDQITVYLENALPAEINPDQARNWLLTQTGGWTREVVLTVRLQVKAFSHAANRELLEAVARQAVATAIRSSNQPIPEEYVGYVEIGVLESVEATALDPNPVTVSYEPEAIRAHFDNDPEMQAQLAEIDDEALYEAAVEHLLHNDPLWEQFHQDCLQIVHDASRDPGP